MRYPLPACAALAVAVVSLTVVSAAFADSIRIGVYSRKDSPTRASTGASIAVARDRLGRATRRLPTPPASTRTPPGQDGVPGSGDTVPARPVLPEDAAILDDPTPAGGGSFWYTGDDGEPCVYVPDGTPVCYTITAGQPAASQPIQPDTVAASLARRLDLTAGRIQTSPARAALTGAPTWFWLDPAPSERTLTTTLAGETVTVTATPVIVWEFGDTTRQSGGPGVPYRPGPVPASAVVHIYQTRCLPNDRGRNPHVLPSCGENGYRVEARITWQISYRASGPITQDGTVPNRTTTTGRPFAVSEARGFLTGARP